MATDARRPSTSYAPQLDGLRAVSVAAVAWSHWLPAWQFGVPLGAGVHLFFVLSGFLITRILLELRAGPDRPAAIGRFYLRRALRLFPAFYVVLAVAWLAEVPLAATTWGWHAAYLSNVFIAVRGEWQGHFSHFWSLAVEEQFYLVWPWLIVWSPARWLGPLLGVTVVAGPLARAVASWRGLGEPFWALVPAGSADSLAVGALVAWVAWTRPDVGPRVWPRAAALGGLAWLGLAAGEATGVTWPVAVTIWRQVLQATVFAWIVWRGVDGFAGMPGRVLASPALVAIGRISYGVYLVHAFAPIVLDAICRRLGVVEPGALPIGVRAAGSWFVSLALAAVLWQIVEAPARRLKARL